MLTIQEERIEDCFEQVKAIFPEHWEELALDKDKVKLDPDYEVYFEAERRGQLLLVTIRKDAAVIGYFVGFIRTDLHYKTCLTCRMDIFMLKKEHRGSSIGIKLFKTVQRICNNRGVKRIVVGSKTHKDASKLFEFLGYTEIERFYSLYIGD